MATCMTMGQYRTNDSDLRIHKNINKESIQKGGGRKIVVDSQKKSKNRNEVKSDLTKKVYSPSEGTIDGCKSRHRIPSLRYIRSDEVSKDCERLSILNGTKSDITANQKITTPRRLQDHLSLSEEVLCGTSANYSPRIIEEVSSLSESTFDVITDRSLVYNYKEIKCTKEPSSSGKDRIRKMPMLSTIDLCQKLDLEDTPTESNSATKMKADIVNYSRYGLCFSHPNRKDVEPKKPCVKPVLGLFCRKMMSVTMNDRHQTMPNICIPEMSSSSSPSVPYSTADILYNGETTRSSITDDFSPNDLVYSDKVSGRLKENNDNKRPNSRNTSRRSISLEKVSINGDREDLQPIKTSTISKQNHFRPTGIRQSYLRGEQFYSNNTPSKTGSNSSTGSGGVQKEDLVAMGTLWNPNAPRSNGVAVSNSKQYPNGGSNNLPPRRGGPTTSRFAMGAGSSRQPARDVEPKYTDPAVGATNSFQQRLIDLSALEAETVRWERSKKVKKKPKQDRDS